MIRGRRGAAGAVVAIMAVITGATGGSGCTGGTAILETREAGPQEPDPQGSDAQGPDPNADSSYYDPGRPPCGGHFDPCVPPETCFSSNCAGCCDTPWGPCINSDTRCGPSCAWCAKSGLVCAQAGEPNAGTCVPPRPSCKDTCAGCCAGNTCVSGFSNNQCGSSGAACADCTPGGACGTAVIPRSCCPGPYAACAAAVTTAVLLTHQNTCTTTDLGDLKTACSAGLASAPCQNFMTFLKMNKPACFACVTPFASAPEQQTGVFACVATYVNAACNHSTGCQTDCVTSSCGTCAAGSETACRTTTEAGTCNTFVAASTSCTTAALASGSGAFCNPSNATYAGNYGAWIAGVATVYCGP